MYDAAAMPATAAPRGAPCGLAARSIGRKSGVVRAGMYYSAPRTPPRVPAAAVGRAKARRLAPPLPPPPPLLLLLLLAAITDRGSCGDVLGSSTAAGP
eukprot:COSAG01_NODE_28939_length_649_cov_0.847273_2_plen_97_part_01